MRCGAGENLEIISKDYLSLSATGAAQSSLEGKALASGCTGCDGKAIYATITKVIYNDKWYNYVESVAVEDAEDDVIDVTIGTPELLKVFAVMKHGSPKPLTVDQVTVVVADTSKATLSGLTLTGVEAGTTTLTVTIKDTEEETTPISGIFTVTVANA